MNVVMTGDGRFVEVQGTAEGEPFDRAQLDALLDLAAAGCAELTALQQAGAGRRLSHARSCWRRRNAHKVAELRPHPGRGRPATSSSSALDAFPDVPEVAETEPTFEGNALLKARAVAAATGLPAVADDSGLCVDVLNGMPGIFSARGPGRHGDDAGEPRAGARPARRRARRASRRGVRLRGGAGRSRRARSRSSRRAARTC